MPQAILNLLWGGNIIDKIKCKNKYGSDINPYLIALLEKARDDADSIPDTITKEEYQDVKENYLTGKYEDWYIGLVGFCASYNSKWFNGYAGIVDIKDGKRRHYNQEAIRNIKKQATLLKDIQFKCIDFREIHQDIKKYVIYCDIPYRNTTRYKTDDFPYDDFYEWAIKMSTHNWVFISEYNMPKGFKCIWEKEMKTNMSRDKKLINTERLFIPYEQKK